MICVQRGNVLNKVASFVVSSLRPARYTKIGVPDMGGHFDDQFGVERNGYQIANVRCVTGGDFWRARL